MSTANEYGLIAAKYITSDKKLMKNKRCDWCGSPISHDASIIYLIDNSQFTACSDHCRHCTTSSINYKKDIVILKYKEEALL